MVLVDFGVLCGRDVFMAECIGVTFLEIIPCVAPDNIDSHQRTRQAQMVHRNGLLVESGTAARRYLSCIAVEWAVHSK